MDSLWGNVNVLDGLIYNFQTIAKSGIANITTYFFAG